MLNGVEVEERKSRKKNENSFLSVTKKFSSETKQNLLRKINQNIENIKKFFQKAVFLSILVFTNHLPFLILNFLFKILGMLSVNFKFSAKSFSLKIYKMFSTFLQIIAKYSIFNVILSFN